MCHSEKLSSAILTDFTISEITDENVLKWRHLNWEEGKRLTAMALWEPGVINRLKGEQESRGGGFQKQPASLPFSALNVHHWVFDGEEKLGYIVKGSRGVVSSSFFKTRTPAPFAMLPFLKNKVCLVRDVSRPISPHLQLPATHQNSQCQHASQHAHTLI